MKLYIVKHFKEFLPFDNNPTEIERCDWKSWGKAAKTTFKYSKLLHFSIFLDTGQSKNAALIGGVAGVSGFGLIAIVALAVLFVKYRIARRFMNRNKVGDLYTTQEEQISRKNAYIQEDDMIEKEDSF